MVPTILLPETTVMTRPILYSFRRCPYAMRARLAIAASRIEVELREIVLRDKPVEFLSTSPKGTVPVLVTETGEVLEQSLDIMFWALERNDHEGWLALDIEERRKASELIARADDGFKTNLDRYKYASRYVGAEPFQARMEASFFLKDLDGLLRQSPYLLGQRISVADMAIAPFVRQFANVDRLWFDAEDWPDLLLWLEGFLQSERFHAIMTKYSKWQAGDASVLFP